MEKRPMKYVAKPGEPTLEQKLKAYRKMAKQIAERKSQTEEDTGSLQFRNADNSEKKTPKLTPAMRASLKLKILRGAKENPEFEKELTNRMEENQSEPQYLTEAHKKNEEAAMKQTEIWQKSSASSEDILKRQRLRDEKET